MTDPIPPKAPADDNVKRVARAICPQIMYQFDSQSHEQSAFDKQTDKDKAVVLDIAHAALSAMLVQSPPPIMGEGLVEYVAKLLWKMVSPTRWDEIGEATRDHYRAFARTDLAALATPSLPEGMTPEGAWQDLVEKDDRTSPPDRHGKALITFEELADYMRSALAPEGMVMVPREALEGLADVLEHDCGCPPCEASMAPGEHYLGVARRLLATAPASALRDDATAVGGC